MAKFTEYPLDALGRTVNLADIPGNYNLQNKYYIDTGGVVYVTCASPRYDKKRVYVRKMSPDINNGYIEYVLQNKEGRAIHVQAHRLCALAFIPNPDPENKTDVNHKDGRRDNCHVDNLEWVTHQANIKHSYDYIRKKKK